MSNRALNILSIDIDAALRKLTGKRFKSIDDPALELVRFAVAGVPKGIHVQLRNRSLIIETMGRRVDPEPFRQLAVLLDPNQGREARSHALAGLEQAVGLDILAAFAGTPGRVTFSWQTDAGGEGVRFAAGERPEQVAHTGSGSLSIRIRGGLPAKADPLKIAEKCRFSQIPVVINGHLASRGIKVESSLIRQKLTGGDIVGVVGIPKEGDLTQITLLDNGIISDELYMPAQGGLVFHATVLAKRSDFQEVYPTLRNAAKRLLVPLANGYPSLSAKRQKLAEVRLFDRFEVTRESILVRGVDAFRTVAGERLDLPELMRHAKSGDLFAVDEGADEKSFAVKNRHVVVVTRRQRRILDTLLDAPLKTPPKRIINPSRRCCFKDRLRPLLVRLTPAGKPLPRSALGEDERRFLEMLSRAARHEERPWSLEMTDGGAFPPRRTHTEDGPCYLIPRGHPIVRAMVRDVLRDPAFLTPALALLIS